MSVESGIKPGRMGFLREIDPGVTPLNPDWIPYSNSYQSFSLSPNPTYSERRRVGSPDVQDFSAGSEDHQLEIDYDMQQWFVDGGGSPLDAATDGMLRDPLGDLLNSHSILMRTTLGGRGVAGAGARQYVYATGAYIDTVNVEGEPESGDPLGITLSYMAIKARNYRIDQPAASTVITVRSTEAADTTQEVTIESDGAAVSETVVLNGTTAVTTTASFTSIDAINLSAQTQGNIIVEDSADNQLSIIYGALAYQGREGDTGVPLLGSGSHPTFASGDFNNLLGDIVLRGNEPLLRDVDIASMSFAVNNNIDAQPSHKTIGRRLNVGDRSITIAATIFGPSASYDSISESLRVIQSDIQWTFSGASGGVLLFPGAALTDLGSIAWETSQATMSIDNTFTSKGIEIDPA